ncbi:MAG: AEC family transporter [Comamonadaceae bacterium]|nr:MAG: AEC family transporter [Comamonadaceae bacterium]
MTQLVLSAMLPVFLMIAAGFLAARKELVRPTAIKDLSNLVFLLITPALFFRTMSQVHVEELDFRPVAAYFVAAGILFGAILLVQGFNRRAAVLALAGTFSNTVMIGIPLVGLMYGPQGMVTLLTLISVHALVLLTSATLVLEFAVAHEQNKASPGPAIAAEPPAPRQPLLMTVFKAVKNSIIHPVPLPIICGLLYAQTGLGLHPGIDRALELLGSAFAPMALVLVGITLGTTPVGRHFRGALSLALVKNIAHPLLVFLLCRLFGVGGLPMGVMVLASALPIGANVFLFAQRYKVAEDLVTASVVVSTALALVTLSVVLLLSGYLY